MGHNSETPTQMANSCRHCLSYHTTGFQFLSAENVAKLDTYKSGRHFKKNEVIFEQGQDITQVYCLRTGLVKIETIGSDGAVITVGFLKGGDMLGLGPILAHQAVSFSATAIEDTTACAFKGELMMQLLQETPQMALQYLSGVFGELRQTQTRLLSGVEKDVHGRVAEALIYLKTNFPEHTFTRKEIAEWAGTTTESVIRTLATFEEDGLIKQEGRRIDLLKKDDLKELAGMFV